MRTAPQYRLICFSHSCTPLLKKGTVVVSHTLKQINYLLIIIIVEHLNYITIFFQAVIANSQFDYTLGRQLSQKSLWFNIAAVVSFILLTIVAVLLGIAIAATSNNNVM